MTTQSAGGLVLPALRMLDASAAGLDFDGLRALAHEQLAEHPCVSRSYRYPYAIVAGHERPVGVDIERIVFCDAPFAATVCTPDELASVPPTPGPGRDLHLTTTWSGKEALAKALGNARDYEPSRLESPWRWPDGRSGRWKAARLFVAAGHVGWVCWQP